MTRSPVCRTKETIPEERFRPHFEAARPCGIKRCLRATAIRRRRRSVVVKYETLVPYDPFATGADFAELFSDNEDPTSAFSDRNSVEFRWSDFTGGLRQLYRWGENWIRSSQTLVGLQAEIIKWSVGAPPYQSGSDAAAELVTRLESIVAVETSSWASMLQSAQSQSATAPVSTSTRSQ